MNIILLNKRFGCSGCITLTRQRMLAFVLSLFVIMPAALLYAGYQLGTRGAETRPDALNQALQAELQAQHKKIKSVTEAAEDNMNALALKLGQMQAHVMRLDALGERLTKMAKLDKGEFDFENPPGQGGPASNTPGQSIAMPDFLQSLKELSAQIDDRSRQLHVLESMLMNRNLQAEVMPAGRPIRHGWISSLYGMRTDPFTGKQMFHAGIDFAGKRGSNVMAVAAGVVTWAGKRSGYGNLVEINHGNGYATRYGHNEKLLVKVGQTVKKGQVIAKMGSTGRSTGPHVHFEVLYHGHPVNPRKYIRAASN